MPNFKFLCIFLKLFLVLLCVCNIANATQVSHDGRAITINGQRRIIISGSIHYPRSTPENEMQNFTTKIVNMVKEENLFAAQGGPIILAQMLSLDIGVPWIMCQQPDAPQPMINTCNGWYCDNFTPNNPNSPKMWTENWTGWFKNWGGLDPKRTAEDVAFAVARFFQSGGTFQNYYMYHGGTNFGRSAGGPYITTSYDYDAPLDEYGNLNQPKYGHLKELHDVLHSMEKILTYGNITKINFGNSVSGTIYATINRQTCFFVNANTAKDAEIFYEGKEYHIPAWSVSILRDCNQEIYNTAKVNTQTWVMEKQTNEAEIEPESLKWVWRPESIDDLALRGNGKVSAKKLIDQKVADDVSDYLWYMTNFYLHKNDPVWSNEMSLRVNATGQVLHVYVNGEYLGGQRATYDVFNYVFEKKIKLNPGPNKIILLSATIGLQNYGPKFDLIQTGVPGPVEIIGKKGDDVGLKNTILNLLNNITIGGATLNSL
ncbi:hypothetical protein LXL04_018395 [Taraxacum kok-saghyz]